MQLRRYYTRNWFAPLTGAASGRCYTLALCNPLPRYDPSAVGEVMVKHWSKVVQVWGKVVQNLSGTFDFDTVAV